jgi:hypothetical protein
MEKLTDFAQDVTYRMARDQVMKLEDQIFKALHKHGYDVNCDNMKEFAQSHKLETLQYEGLSTLYVNNKSICCWTDWEMEPYDFTKELTIKASFKFQIL